MTETETNYLTDKFRDADNRLVLLDYDGTLVNFSNLPGRAIPNKELLMVLENLIEYPKTKVFIITGRVMHEIDQLLGHLQIGIFAEHGAALKENGSWEMQLKNDSSWKNLVLPLMNKYVTQNPGSFIEEKYYALGWHYRKVQSDLIYTHTRELIYELKNIIHGYKLKIIDGNKIIEIMPEEIDKGKAVQKLTSSFQYDCILCIVDDRTDEDMFGYLKENGHAYTIKVGEANTVAKYKLHDVQEVLNFLKRLTK